MSILVKEINGMSKIIDKTIKQLTEMKAYLDEQAKEEPTEFPFWYAVKILYEEPFTEIVPIGVGIRTDYEPYEYVMYDPSEGIITKTRDYTLDNGDIIIGERTSHVYLGSLMCYSRWKRAT